jgi:protein-tyrosine phosphatase
MRILVVCTANICRSPVAASLLERALARKNARLSSAGTAAMTGSLVDPTMQRLCEQRGWADLSQHRSQPVMPLALAQSDVVLCMEHRHLRELSSMAPTRVGTIKLLGHWGIGEIADPYRGTADQYDRALNQIEAATQKWAEKLVQLGMVN